MNNHIVKMLELAMFLLVLVPDIDASSETVLNAAVMGHKGKVNADDYNAIAETMAADDKSSYCRVQFSALEYDTSNGSTVYSSLKNARAAFENGSVAVAIGPQIDVFTSTDYVILNQIHFVTTSDAVTESANRTMPILPDPKSLSIAIAKVAKDFGWNKVAFLSQDDFSPVLALGGEGIFVSPIRLPTHMSSSDNPQLQQTLTTLRESQMDKFILHSMDKDVVKTVITAAQKLHLLHHSISWFITYLDFEDIVDDIKEVAKLYGLQLFKSTDRNFPPGLKDIFNGTVSRFKQGLMSDVVGILRHYLQEHVDCSVEPADNSSMTAEDFQKTLATTFDPYMNTSAGITPYSGSLGKYFWPKVSHHNSANVRNEYAIPIHRKVDTMIKISQVIFNRNTIEVSNYFEKDNPHVEDPFKSKTFDVIAKQDTPFVIRKPDGTYEGFCVDVLKELSQNLNNFQYNIFELEEEKEQQNGKARVWDEIIAQLKNGNASMAIGAFAVTADRESKISFSYTIISSAVSLLLKRPPETTNYFQFLGPFSTTLWIMIVVFFVVVGLGLYLMSRFDSTQDGSDQKFNLKESMWYSITVLLQGSTEFSPQTTCMRTIVAFFWFCTLVINAAYTANLAAFLTLQQIDNRIKSVDQLARQTMVKYGVLNNSDLMHFFETERDDPYERMWAFMKLNEATSLLPSRDLGRDYVLDPDRKYIYLDDGVINNYIAQQNCEVESIEQNFGIKHFSMGFPKGAPYRGDINRALLALKEDGTLDSLRNKWWSSDSNCSVQTSGASKKVNTASELDISNMFGVFIVLIAFTVLAILYEVGKCIFIVVQEKKKKKEEQNGDNKDKPPDNNSIQFGQLPTNPPPPPVDHREREPIGVMF